MSDWLAFHNEMGRSGMLLLQRLAEAGYAAYFVGGCVRDALLGRAIKDMDIATSATPEEVLALFPEAIPTGLQHGTVTVPTDGWHFEVTTFRAETGYSDGRHPDEVLFLHEIEGDLERRDFTVNAMAVGIDGKLVDPFHGREDLERRILRAVGKAADRFDEDALRMLRCVRFASEYGFTVEEETWREVLLSAPGLRRIAMERVFAELTRMMSGADPYRALKLLQESELLHWCKERLRFPRSLGLGRSGEECYSEPLERLGQISDVIGRWTFWFLRMELLPEDGELACRALKTPNAFMESVLNGIRLHRSLEGTPSKDARKAWIEGVLRYGRDTAIRWMELAETYRDEDEYAWMGPYADNGYGWLDQMAVYELKDLAIRGNDIIAAAGRKGGPWLSAVLNRLLLEAALGELPNERALLLERAAFLSAQDRKG